MRDTEGKKSMQFWSSARRGAVEIATFSNPPYNYLGKPVIDELEQLVVDWQDPTIRAVVIQSHPQGTAGFGQYSVEELFGMASDPGLSRFAGAAVRGFKAIFDQMMALPKVTIAAMNGDAMGGSFELTLACDLRIGQRGDFRYGNPEVRAKRALYQGADTNLQAAYEIENMNWTEVMQSDDAQLALKTFLAVDPISRRDWLETASSKTYPSYSGH